MSRIPLSARLSLAPASRGDEVLVCIGAEGPR